MISPETFSELEKLAAAHPEANNPYEPYQGVAALFNADLHTGDPQWAPREDWAVISKHEIVLDLRSTPDGSPEEYVSPNPMLEEMFQLIVRITGNPPLNREQIAKLHEEFPTPTND